ncbi:Gfo/Idh/MocA family oxidoreductase [Streptomyces somaliensis DSM 40738]|uniref:Gfo/Idh/MocA family oxidoreductase n=1 Tax=Streptomyces somaliensis (strain ATCC 33201 / DSM 40738 / JCM 12659 / KCTC 9044 / NCTC 11332 / NRRL B-12077 / IP 733) TaxID=1134445 RepID=A0AA44DFV6_STRE0|nr:Gfo/Idh/MocA family oxidoreductase [Streptomyces somaliensis]MCQ0024898.1 Gfo/Idh/MocA family oxidoreductase [Streptomyces somaliensis DSM 40738]NKY15859.1 Gfo/Idh/MocA family oxidoreductase [Streptomyces somaliensis DSM 40738]
MRVGVVGLGMGLHLAVWCRRVGMDVVAVCDRDPGRRAAARAELPGAAPVEEWPGLLEHRLDAVVLANDFDEHAPLAVAFLERGVHVLSESAACADYEEGCALVSAADRSRATYSFAENYVAHPHVRLVREAVRSGELGRIGLVEADYLHGMSPEDVGALVDDPAHWRGRIAPTAYCTHTLSPVLAITDARPVEVTAFVVDEADPRGVVVMVTRLSSGALAVTRHGFLQGEPDSHWSWVSVRGSRGLAESVRAPGERAWAVRFRTEGWAAPDGRTRDEERLPPPLLLAGRPVGRRDEGTVRVLRAFRATVEEGRPPLVDVRAAVAASLVGVAGAESLANGSRPVTVPAVPGA